MSSTTARKKPDTPIELWDRQTVLEFFGGSKPLHLSTLYRGVAFGIYPRPVTVSGRSGGGVVRWVRTECEAALARMIERRDEAREPPQGRGRRRRAVAQVEAQ